MARDLVRRIRRRLWLPALLAWVGGSVDAIGYLTMFELFTSHQTGNTAIVGVSTGLHDWHEAIRRIFPVSIFVLGVIVGALLSRFALILGTEAVVLLLFLVLGTLALVDGVLSSTRASVFYPLAALPALAMGIQNTSLKKVVGLSVRTTFITGILCTMAEELAEHLVWLWTAWRRGRPLRVLLRIAPRQPALNRALLAWSIWASFLAGAVSGALAQQHWHLLALAGPIVVLTTITVVDLAWPLSAAEHDGAGAGS
jgi:uncharacterized membrane protein YoaK (UPF0700 family)